mgnify:FL=1
MNKLSAQLKDSVAATSRLQESVFQPKNEFLRDSTIQRFEFTFELAWKVMKSVNAMLGVECNSPRQCIRVSAQTGLINHPERWISYANQRNYASHIYSESMAESIYESAKACVGDVEALIEKVKEELAKRAREETS